MKIHGMYKEESANLRAVVHRDATLMSCTWEVSSLGLFKRHRIVLSRIDNRSYSTHP